MTNYQKILIIKLGSLGDWIQMTGWFAAIRNQYPQAHITLLTGTPYLKMAQASPFFNDYLIDNRTRSPKDWYRITKTILADGGYDLIIDLQQQKRTRSRYYRLARLLTKNTFAWAGISNDGLKIRKTPKKPRLIYGTEKIEFEKIQPEPASLKWCKANPETLKLLPKKYVLFIPGCSPTHPYKRWPADSYKALSAKLADQGIDTVVLGTTAEQNEIHTICDQNPKALNFCNKSALLDIPQIAEQALAVVGNDTGPQHMAELGTTPAITLFCARTAPSQVKRSNVTNLVAPEIQDIPVQQVYDTLQSLWHKA